MKRLAFSLAAIGLLCIGFSAPTWALTIQATLDSFSHRTAKIDGIASGGGIGSFSIATPVATGDSLLDDLFADGEFLAYCLEPDQTVNTRQTYKFEVVALSAAPNSPNSGPMGTLGEEWIENIIAASNHNSIEEFVAAENNSRETAFQMALYEGGYENIAAAAFNFGDGDAVVTSLAAVADKAFMTTSANAAGVDRDGINAYGLLNIAQVPTPTGTRTVYTGQDFMVFTRSEETVPVPAPLALMGLGLVGMVGARKFIS